MLLWPSRRRSAGPPPSISQYQSANVPRLATQIAADPLEQRRRLDDAEQQLPDQVDGAERDRDGEDRQGDHPQPMTDVVAPIDARQGQWHGQDADDHEREWSELTSSWVAAIARRSPTASNAIVAGQRGTPGDPDGRAARAAQGRGNRRCWGRRLI